MRLYQLWAREREGPGWSVWCEDGRPDCGPRDLWTDARRLEALLPDVVFEFLVLPLHESPYRVPDVADSWVDPTWGEW